ncbi:uncharacterized protein [Dermacentor albipictus]|uniref:uncharacterized protein isoform X4 n=1 Tax=Dermacentor albipictus TaxID=60249 RepID=UPI0038FC8586
MGAWPGRPRSKRVPCRHRNPSTMFSTHWLHSNIACADRLHSVTRSTAVCKTAIYRTHRFTWLQEQRGDQRPQRHPHVKPHVPVARNVGDTVIQPCRWQEGSVLPPCSRILHFEYRF